ncbi:unnamed protein product [Phytophthora lilii]|uniref:Unnamed protein product n=1 Tax=Phytophthora lilii TaxID=2077276 RepID=A0A9W6X6D6_9STRA|nr:unnamed protein product [Phytophthora lilii]
MHPGSRFRQVLLTSNIIAAAAFGSTNAYDGHGTVYGLTDPSGGNCNLMSYPDYAFTNYAAINAEQWDNSLSCGRCAQVKCIDSKCVNPSQTSAIVFIVDQCHECGEGGLDLSPSVFKAITGMEYTILDIEWEFVSCPVTGNVKYCLKKGSNSHWAAVQPTNTAVGVGSVMVDDKPTSMVASSYYFLRDDQSQADPSLKLKITTTSIAGEKIEDVVSFANGDCVFGSQQFSGGGSDIALTKATTEAPTTAPPTTVSPTEAPTTAPTTVPPTEVSTTAPPTTVSPTEAPTTAPPTTVSPTEVPTFAPTTAPPTTVPPTEAPTTAPPTTIPPTEVPTTAPPTTVSPTEAPTTAPPTTVSPTEAPTTAPPTTVSPTTVPPTLAPTTAPPTTVPPTEAPTTAPPTTTPPTLAPTTASPTTVSPTTVPLTLAPTTAPPKTASRTSTPATAPPSTLPPTEAPTTVAPTSSPSTSAPTTAAPTTSSPTTSSPTTNAPTTASPATSSPPTVAPTNSPSTDAPTSAPSSENVESAGASISNRSIDAGSGPTIVVSVLAVLGCLFIVVIFVMYIVIKKKKQLNEQLEQEKLPANLDASRFSCESDYHANVAIDEQMAFAYSAAATPQPASSTSL